MATLINVLKADQLQARKNKDQLTATLLTTLIGEAAMIGKNDGNRDTTDQEVQRVIQKFIKGNDEVIAVASGDTKEKAIKENAILQTYLPTQMSESELVGVISAIVDTLPEKNIKMMGSVMSELKSMCDGMYDGKVASQLVKQALSE